jgi:predicted nucleic acid-binding protein
MDKRGQRGKPRVVVDASVVAKWVIPGEPWESEARVLQGKIAFREVEAYAPPLLLYEVASVILKSIFRGVLKIDDGIQALEALKNLGLSIQAVDWNGLAEILRIAIASKLTVYDSIYLQLSKKINAPLITADIQLRQRGRSVTEIILLEDLNNV